MDRMRHQETKDDRSLGMGLGLNMALNERMMAPLNLIICSTIGASVIHLVLSIALGHHGLVIRFVFIVLSIGALSLVNMNFMLSQSVINEANRLANQLHTLNVQDIGSKLPRNEVARRLLTRQEILESCTGHHVGFWAGSVMHLTRHNQFEVSG